jgi:hypothetical protein
MTSVAHGDMIAFHVCEPPQNRPSKTDSGGSLLIPKGLGGFNEPV